MALIKRYQNTLKGRMIVTGNTMMLYQPTIAQAGPFTSTNTALQDGTSPPGTTRTWQQNSSMAVLTIPAGGIVAYAELTWTSLLSGGGFDVSANKNTPVIFKTPITSTTVSPQATDDTGTNAIYTRSADVTALVKAGGSGQYSVGAVAGLNGYQVAANGIGWALTVIINLSTDNFRLFQINVGNQLLNGLATLDFLLTGFSTPATGPVTGKLFMGVQRGDPGADFANVTVGPSATVQNLQLTRPPLPSSNMFIGIISNTETGAVIDTSGTFGNNNNTLSPPTAVTNARFHFDIASFDISSSLTNNQNTLNTKSVSLTSNSVFDYNIYNLQVEVQAANLVPVIKSASEAQGDVGDTITYTLSFQNSGQVPADNVIITDTLPNGISYIPNSISVQGAPNPPTGTTPQSIPLGSIAVGTRVTVTFNVLVTTIPSPNPIVNSADAGYDFTSAPGLPPNHANDQTNAVSTYINHVDVGSSKQVNKTYANVGDILTYTIPINAIGNTTAINVIFSDTIPNGTTLITSSFTQNGVILAGSPNPPGVTLNNIESGKTTTIVFKVQVNTIPSPNPILNAATTVFTYTVDNSITPVRTATRSTNTNIVSTQVNNANLGNILKYTDKSFATCQEIITYTILVPNTGNVTAQNVVFKDTIPNGTTFVTNSVTINGAVQSGINPGSGVTIPNIAPGTTATITFQVQVQC